MTCYRIGYNKFRPYLFGRHFTVMPNHQARRLLANESNRLFRKTVECGTSASIACQCENVKKHHDSRSLSGNHLEKKLRYETNF